MASDITNTIVQQDRRLPISEVHVHTSWRGTTMCCLLCFNDWL